MGTVGGEESNRNECEFVGQPTARLILFPWRGRCVLLVDEMSIGGRSSWLLAVSTAMVLVTIIRRAKTPCLSPQRILEGLWFTELLHKPNQQLTIFTLIETHLLQVNKSTWRTQHAEIQRLFPSSAAYPSPRTSMSSLYLAPTSLLHQW